MIKIDFNAFFKEQNLNKSKIARSIGISPQALHHHLEKGDIPTSYLFVIAKELNIKVSKLCVILEKNTYKNKKE